MYQITYFSLPLARLIPTGAVEGQNVLERLADLQKEGIRPVEITLDGEETDFINRIFTEINPALEVDQVFIKSGGMVVLRGYFVGLLNNLAANLGRRLGALKVLDRSRICAISPTMAKCGWCGNTSEVVYTHNHTYLCSFCADWSQILQKSSVC